MVVKPLTPPAAWSWYIHATGGLGGLPRTFSDDATEAIWIINLVLKLIILCWPLCFMLKQCPLWSVVANKYELINNIVSSNNVAHF